MATSKLTAYRSLFDAPPPVVSTTIEEERPVRGGFSLRPYQIESVDSIFREWERHQSVLLELATGLGKTVCFAETCKRWLDLHDSRILVLAHRRELIDQAADKITKHTKRGCVIEMGDMRAPNRERDRILVASVQTMIAGPECDRCKGEGSIPDDDGRDCATCFGTGRLLRMHRFRPEDYGLVIVDEGHHGTARSYRNIAKWFGRNKNLKQLYVTATPERTDKVGLKNVCDTVAFRMGILEGIEEGYLVDVRQKYVMVKGLDLTKCATKKGGDFADGALEKLMDDSERVHEQVTVTMSEAAGKQVLFFASGKQHARDICNSFNSYGVNACCVLDDTPSAFRTNYFRQFREREIQVLVNCGVATEGFDADCVEVIANARPTKSKSLYTQIIGRGTRPLNAIANEISTCGVSFVRREMIANSKKPHCLVLDFVGISGKHKLVSTADVLAGDALPEDVDSAVKRAKKSGETVDIRKAVRDATDRRVKREQAKREEEERRRALQDGPKYQANYETREVSLFDRRARTQSQSGGASPAQVAALVGLGYSKDFAMRCSKKQAGALIGKGRAKAEGKVSKPAAEPLPFKPYSSGEVNFDEVFSLFGRD